MTDSALDIALAIDPTRVNKVKDIIQIMDKVYLDDNDLSMKCDEFDRLIRKREQSMKEFIHLYEQKVNELKAGEVIIPDIVLATKILRAANLLPNHYLIARSSCTIMTFENAKNALLRVSEKCPVSRNSGPDMIHVKQENADYEELVQNMSDVNLHNTYYGFKEDDEVFFNNGSRNQSQKINNNRNFHLRQCYNCGDSGHGYRECPNKLPSQQRIRNQNRQCYGCGDINHWIKDCPHMKEIHNLVRNIKKKPYRQNTLRHNKTYLAEDEIGEITEEDRNGCFSQHELFADNEKSVLFLQSDVGNEVEDILLVGETVNNAVLDSGASKTVCSLEWYNCYIDSLDEDTRTEVKEYSSDTIFRFGVGKLKARKMVYPPVVFCEKKIKLEVQVVNADIPLLLSLKTMKEMGLQIFIKIKFQ